MYKARVLPDLDLYYYDPDIDQWRPKEEQRGRIFKIPTLSLGLSKNKKRPKVKLKIRKVRWSFESSNRCVRWWRNRPSYMSKFEIL
jgi:hypothetical protein